MGVPVHDFHNLRDEAIVREDPFPAAAYALEGVRIGERINRWIVGFAHMRNQQVCSYLPG